MSAGEKSVNVSANSASKQPSSEETERDACVLCCKEVEIYSIGECDHPICYECSTRLRVLCEQNECPICRQVLSKVSLNSSLPVFFFFFFISIGC